MAMPAKRPVGVVDAAREVQVPFGIGGVAQRLADERGIGVAVAVELEIALAGDADRRRRRIAGDDGAVAVGDAHDEHQPGRQQAFFGQRRQRGGRAFQLDRVLEDLQGLVDAAEVARQLRLVGVDQLAHRLARGGLRGGAFEADEVAGDHPDRRQQQQREQRQRDVGFQPAPEPAPQRRVAGRGAVHARARCRRFRLGWHGRQSSLSAAAAPA